MAFFPHETLARNLEEILRELAGSNTDAQKRVHSDAIRLYNAKGRAKGIKLTHSSKVDKKAGLTKLKAIKGHAEKLSTALNSLAPNLRAAWPDHKDAAAAVEGLIVKAETAATNFRPRGKSGTRNWDARSVDSWASKVFITYIGKGKASRTSNFMNNVTEGRYVLFLKKIFVALGIDASAPTVIRARRERDSAAEKPQK